jgi:GAF domain-containing protein
MFIRSQDSSIQRQSKLNEIQGRLVGTLLKITAVIGFLPVLISTLNSFQSESGLGWPIWLYWGGYSIVLSLNFLRKAPYPVKAWAIIILLFIKGTTDFLNEGLNGSSQVIMASASILAGILLGYKAGRVAILFTISIMLGYAFAFSSGYLVDPYDIRSSILGDWLVGSGIVLLLSALITTALNSLISQLGLALEQSATLTNELNENQVNLEYQIQQRTRDLEERNKQLDLSAKVTRELSTFQDLDQLLEESVNLISTNFNFFHTGIFIIDESRRYAVLKAASSEGGVRMVSQGHQLQVGEVGIVGYVADRGKPRISLDVGEDAIFFHNPELPTTRSEMALPLQVRGQIIGVLDIQSEEPAAFDQEDITILQGLADQTALAINNTRLLADLKNSLTVTQRAYGEISLQAWQKYFADQQGFVNRYDPEGILPSREPVNDATLIFADGGSTTEILDSYPTIAVSIKAHEQIIGHLNAYKHPGDGVWTQEEIFLMEAITEQLGVALESARSYQETQVTAIREQTTREATSRLRETLDIETIIKTATEEIRKALDLPEVTIRLGKTISDPSLRSS